MSEYVEAKILDAGKAKQFINSFGSTLKNVLMWLGEISAEVKKQQEIKDKDGNVVGTLFTIVTGNDHKVKMKLLQSSGREGLFDVYLLGDNGRRKAYPHTKESDIDDKITDFIEYAYDAESFEEKHLTQDKSNDFDISNFEASKKLQVELSKVYSSGEIKYGKLYCNYDYMEAYQDLSDVVYDDNINESITETPQILEIIPVDDSLQVNIIDEILPMDPVIEILKAQYIALLKLESKIHEVSCLDDYPMKWIDIITWQRNWLLESKLMFVKNFDIIDMIKTLDFEKIKSDICDISCVVEEYATCLDLYYNNFDHEIQKLLDDWLLTLRWNR